MIRLSDHLKGFSIVHAHVSPVKEQMRSQLVRFGPVTEVHLSDWPSIAEFLTPLRSFPTHYAALGLDEWTILLNNMRWETCHVDILSITKSLGCSGLTVYFRDDSRQLHMVKKGQAVRDVVCYEDGGKWFFHDVGEPADFENTERYASPRIRDRLTPKMVCDYFKSATGITIPFDWKTCRFAELIGLERSTHEVKVEITSWDTLLDS